MKLPTVLKLKIALFLLMTIITFTLLPSYHATAASASPQEEFSLVVKSLQRKLVINPDVTCIEDQVYFKNVGSNSVATILIKLPKQSSDIKIYDTISFLNFDVTGEEDDKLVLNVHPRFELEYNMSTSFTVYYTIPSSLYLTPSGSFTLHLNTILEQYPYKVESLVLTIYTPETTTSVSNLSPQPNSFTEGWRYKLVYVFNSPQSSDSVVKFDVSYTFYAVIPKYAILALAIIVLVSVFIVLRKVKRQVRKKIEFKKPTIEVSDLTALIDKWFSIQAEVVKTEEEYRSGKISKKEYSSRIETLKKDIKDLTSLIENKTSKLSKELKQHAKELSDIAKTIKDTASEFSKLEEACRQYAVRQITRSQYEKMKAQTFNKASQVKSKLHRKISEIEESISS